MHKVGKRSLRGCGVWTSLEPLMDGNSETPSVNIFQLCLKVLV